MPRIDRIRWRSLISRGEPPVRSTHFVKSISLTSCSTRTSATETLTTLTPCAMPATQSFPRIAARPCATASYSVAAVTSTVCETPSISRIVTRQERTGMGAKYHIRFVFAIGQRCSCGRRAAGRQSKRAGASWSSYGWLKDAVAYLFEKDAADDSIGPAGPDDVDFDVARQIPHQINTI